MTDPIACWCGNAALTPFSTEYLRCGRCETLVRARTSAAASARMADDDDQFYGREYWFAHQERDLGCPNIRDRARADLPERSLYWLRALLRYKLPPARVLEIGSGPGSFLPLLQWAGFDATGLELSPWVVQFIRETFQVPMLCGPVEDQPIEPASVDVIAMMDVLEHLPDPVRTVRHCLGLLRVDGLVLIQTPCYREGRAHTEIVADQDRFLEMLRPPDHLYLFSRTGLRKLLHDLGLEYVVFEPALFAEYDMFAVASRLPPATQDQAAVERALGAGPTPRMVQALLDLDDQRREIERRRAEAEADRTSRLSLLDEFGRRLGEAEGARNALQLELAGLRETVRRLEQDQAARLEVIEAQGHRLGEVEGERNALQLELSALRESVQRLEQDHAARLEVIEAQGHRLGAVEGERNALQLEVTMLREALEQLEIDRAARLEMIEAQDARLGAADRELAALRAELIELRRALHPREAKRASRRM